jgi:hypothetical protein
MRQIRFSEEQIINALKEHAAGSVPQVRHQRCDVLQVAIEVGQAWTPPMRASSRRA